MTSRLPLLWRASESQYTPVAVVEYTTESAKGKRVVEVLVAMLLVTAKGCIAAANYRISLATTHV